MGPAESTRRLHAADWILFVYIGSYYAGIYLGGSEGEVRMTIRSLFSLDGRVALVTGGYRGIGRMIAEGFISFGAKVYISARDADACNQAAEELARQGGSCIALPMDISTLDGVRALSAEYCALEPKLDILVNNAGAAWGAAFDDFPEHGWDKVLDLNAKTPFFLTQALAPALRASGTASQPAKVINIASVDGGIRLTHNETYSYVTSKAGLIQLTRLMAARLVKDHVNVTAIAPGAFQSTMNEAIDHAAELAGQIPSRRIGIADDMAGAAVYLASRAGDYVVGATLTVDGGLTFANQPAKIGADT
jgi:NAD(P)-dependent dehydrogenase (short-subunit alcohol dehydrogenase family)